METNNLLALMLRRESEASSYTKSLGFYRDLNGHSALVRHVSLTQTLEAHRGCVNRISWSECGNYLLSGSDDLTLCVWSMQNEQPKLEQQIHTPHRANIFGVRFIPGTNCRRTVSGGMDHNVVVMERERPENALYEFHAHEDRVKTVDVERMNPDMVWSAGEDGTVRQFDLRMSQRDATDSSMLINLPVMYKNLHLEIKAAHINQSNPNEILVAASDSPIRLFDRRKIGTLKTAASQSSASISECVLQMAPMHMLHGYSTMLAFHNAFPTYAQFSYNGKECVANYSNDHVYVFDLSGAGSVVAQCEKPSGSQGAAPLEVESDQVQTLHSRFVPRCTVDFSQLLAKWKGRKAASFRLYLNRGIHAFLSHKRFAAVEYVTHALLVFPDHPVALMWHAETQLDRALKGDDRSALRDTTHIIQLLEQYPREMEAVMKFTGCMTVVVKWLRLRAIFKSCFSEHAGISSTARISSKLRMYAEGLDVLSRDFETEYIRHGTEDLESSGMVFAHAHWKSVYFKEIPEHLESMKSRIRNVLSSPKPEPRARTAPSTSTSMAIAPAPTTTAVDVSAVTHETVSSLPNGDDSGSILGVVEESQESKNRKLALLFESLGDLSRLNYSMRFTGQTNIGTDIKEANFLGGRSQCVVSGSDDGRMFIWSKLTGELLCIMDGADEDVLNCVQPHPDYNLVASSGIEDNIKIWQPSLDKLPAALFSVANSLDQSESLYNVLEDRLRSNESPDLDTPMIHVGNLGDFPVQLLHRLLMQGGRGDFESVPIRIRTRAPRAPRREEGLDPEPHDATEGGTESMDHDHPDQHDNDDHDNDDDTEQDEGDDGDYEQTNQGGEAAPECRVQ
eukprot:CAMPEP_0184699594 /NCGR_PEP_ID=MMETSP0313-20130426/5816_1 /TAXON_ID=2792 /ORGANISM="Porphyridium aerugineum, Strain SAG 1380-2" /LENGTH=846 /DNA_ID=CAMNT_0027158713 /DNA_START=233 /DNA_END=2773 /DNA_ORIENTATION=+